MSNQYNKYNNSKIYKIWSPNTELIYIGSTTQLLCKRLADHTKNFNLYKNSKYHYTSSFKILEYQDAKIELIENVNCNDREQLHKREGEFIRQNREICVNKKIEGRAQQEYKEQAKIYYEDNKEELLEYQKLYRETHKEQIAEKDKKYYDTYKDQILEKAKIYREIHKEQISKPYNCICGSTCRYSDKSRHFKTIHHQEYLKDNMFHLLDL